MFSNSSLGHHNKMIMGESKNPTRKDLLKLANHFGLKSGNEIIDEVISISTNWKSDAKDSEVSNLSLIMIQKRLQMVV